MCVVRLRGSEPVEPNNRYGRVVTADRVSLARIEKAVTAVRQWATLAGTPQNPEPGSRLAGDDLVFPALPTSTVTWYAITSAIDHLDLGARQSVTGDGPIMVSASLPSRCCFAHALNSSSRMRFALRPAALSSGW